MLPGKEEGQEANITQESRFVSIKAGGLGRAGFEPASFLATGFSRWREGPQETAAGFEPACDGLQARINPFQARLKPAQSSCCLRPPAKAGGRQKKPARSRHKNAAMLTDISGPLTPVRGI